MGVDEHLLKRLGGRKLSSQSSPSPAPEPSFDESKLMGTLGRAASAANESNRPSPSRDVSSGELRSEIRKLNSSIQELLSVFRKAHEDIRAEPTADLSAKMDKLVEQNEEIARALLLLLELHREHLPQISKHTRISSQLKLRKPSRLMFPDQNDR